MTHFNEFDAMEYSYAHDHGAISSCCSSPEQMLWSAVLHQVIEDALDGDSVAREWLLYEKDDFILVCNLTGISPFSVRSAARRMLLHRHAKN